MSWHIGEYKNTLRMSRETAERLIVEASQNGHNLVYDNEDGLILDCDAMEWMDFFWDDWATEALSDPSVNGDVVFLCADGDQAGQIWGYRFKNGHMVKLSAEVHLQETE
ncbi:hypothetical protein BKG70_00575 [Mycobacteroides chelonae]|uniref:hypothetical protein n=1 Tax=Mycobacteroides chelonae TaxID=1774 RepID=UPI0008A86C8F|nr:hypothetical protein [Mycobacteroides chelonae]OHT91262.1 hypothetical protein BKG70_00575 [Mycobacteroides chelonae]